MKRRPLLLLALLAPGVAPAAPAARPPATVGTCAFTTIRSVEQRLIDGSTGLAVPDSGSAVVLANGVYGVSYEQVPAVNASRKGDRVFTCLVSLPRHCPPGDPRGRWYTTTNLRTKEAWHLPDAEHMCGGA